MQKVDRHFWSGKRIFLTGNSGFKGSWLSLWLDMLGARVTGCSVGPPTEPSLFDILGTGQVLHHNYELDVCDSEKLAKAVVDSEPEIVIHMAAQSLVRDSYLDPVNTYRVNVLGTVNLLESVRHCSSVKAVLIVTSDKVYENQEWIWPYRENDAIGGHDPYSSSKASADLITSAYRSSFFQDKNVAIATGRSGNVIGGGDWAKDRLVPDVIRALVNNKELTLRNPESTRPWQHALEPLSGYLMLCQRLYEDPICFSESWNFGPREGGEETVSTAAEKIAENWGVKRSWEIDSSANPHESKILCLDSSKAARYLNWHPTWNFNRTVKETVQWYKAWNLGHNMRSFTINQIDRYQKEFEAA